MGELLSVLKEKLSIDEGDLWRIKFLFNNKWVFREEMGMNFYDHGWEETGTRILLEKGEVPSNGEFPIVISHKRQVFGEGMGMGKGQEISEEKGQGKGLA